MNLRVVDSPAPAKPPKTLTPPARNPGYPLDLDWVGRVRMNRSALERRAATIGPTVWELDGPIPGLNRSKRLVRTTPE